MKDVDNNSLEKIVLLVLAGVAIGALTWIAIRALKAGSVDPNASALIGVIVTGLIAIGKDILAAIRSYANAAQLGKVTDQLAAAAPVSPLLLPPPDEALPEMDDAGLDAADVVVDAAADARDKLAEQADDRPRAGPRETATPPTEIME